MSLTAAYPPRCAARKTTDRLASSASTFPVATENQLEHISWDEWLKKFDEQNLSFLYQERKASGEDSTFFKFVRE